MIKRSLVLVAATCLVSSAFAGPLSTQMDKVSYAIGYDIGKNFHRQSISINAQTFHEGLNAGLTAQKPALSQKEMQTTLQKFQEHMLEKSISQQEATADKNAKASEAYMAKIAKEPGVKEIEAGLYYNVIKEGDGPKPTANDTVEVNYEGSLPDGKVFDSSYARHQSAMFKVNQVIKGWTKALEIMPVGSTWMIYIAPDLGYGKYAPPVIGPNQALTFKVDLMSIKK